MNTQLPTFVFVIFLLGILVGSLITWIIIKIKLKNSDPLINIFQDIANKSLKDNSEIFLKIAEQQLGKQQEKVKSDLNEKEQAVENLIKPIKEALKESRHQISELEKARSEAYGGIKTQLNEMHKTNQSLTQETHNLVSALKRPEVRGRWGEITLKRLVELAGMVEHCDFDEQVHTLSEDSSIRPDMIVKMPDQRELVVDVKTPLDSYLQAIEAKENSKKEIFLKKHAQNVREHIRKLSRKSYWKQFTRSPEFVILFIPGDQFLSAALNEDPDLIDSALSQQIILATPTSLIALLKAIAYGWKQQALSGNAEQIRELAEALYDRLIVFISHLNKLGKQLSSSVEHYNKAIGSFERKVLPGARKFSKLGVGSKKEIKEIKSIELPTRKLKNDLKKHSKKS